MNSKLLFHFLNINKKSKTKFLLKDVNFNDENNSSYPTKFTLEIKNIPKNIKMQRVLLGEENFQINIKDNLLKNSNLKNRINKEEIENSEIFTLDSKMGGNKSNTEKQLIIEMISDDPTNIPSFPTDSKHSTTEEFNPKVKVNATHKQNKNDDISESIMVFIVLICLFMLFCCSFKIYPERSAISFTKYV